MPKTTTRAVKGPPTPMPSSEEIVQEVVMEAPPLDEPKEAPAEVEVPNGVLVLRNIAEDGAINVDLQMIGDVKVTEADTILRVGLKVLRNRLDLE